jgi:hypothetical protein
MENKKITIRVDATEAKGLSTLNYTKNVDELTPHRVSQLVEVIMIVHDDTGAFEEAAVQISIGNRLSSFTLEMLQYIKMKGWNITATGNYEVDLNDWDHTAPMFVLPMKHHNMVDHMRAVEAFIKSPMKTSKSKNKNNNIDNSVDSIFYQSYKLVSTKIKFNIAHLEVIMFSTMITSYANKDFDIPYDATQGQFGYYSSTMKNRSLSALMAYQGHVAGLLDPNSFNIKNRPPHSFDPLLMG